MELDKIRREVEGKITRKDLMANNQTMELKMKNTEMLLKAELNEEGHAQQDYFNDNFEKVFAQISSIQEASDEMTSLMNDKMKKLSGQVSKQDDGNKMVRNEVMSLSADMAEILESATSGAPTPAPDAVAAPDPVAAPDAGAEPPLEFNRAV